MDPLVDVETGRRKVVMISGSSSVVKLGFYRVIRFAMSKKSPNFDEKEIHTLFDIVMKYANVPENKKTILVTNTYDFII